MRDLWPANPIERLQLAADLLAQIHPRLADELAEGLRRHVREGVDLGRALGLCGGDNGRTPRVRLLLAKRNELLRQALAIAGSVEALAAEIAAYLTRTPAASRLKAEPDPAWSPLRKLLHQAAQWTELPTSAHRLRVATSAREQGLLACAESADDDNQ